MIRVRSFTRYLRFFFRPLPFRFGSSSSSSIQISDGLDEDATGFEGIRFVGLGAKSSSPESRQTRSGVSDGEEDEAFAGCADFKEDVEDFVFKAEDFRRFLDMTLPSETRGM